MKNNFKKEEREKFKLRVLIICAILVLAYSLEAMMMAKDPDVFRQLARLDESISYNDYINSLIGNFFIRLISPLAISLYTFFMVHKSGINFSYKVFFSGMTLIELINIIFQFRLGSVFYYIEILLNLLLLFVIARQERI
ncbi:MAG: hypothetical protein Q4D88_02945 [Anaerococcus sp.]|nr:hypothetical protein [Anaerococcus sp.]